MKKTIEDEIESIRLDSDKISDPFEILTYFMHEHRLLIESKPYIARLLIIELRQSESFYKRNPSYNPMHFYLDFIRDIFAEGVKQGKIRKVDPDIMAVCVLGTMDMILTQWLIHGREYDIEGIWKSYLEIISKGVLKK